MLATTKSGLAIMTEVCDMLEPYKENFVLRGTIGSTDDDVLKKWEPNACGFLDRLAGLKHAYDHGFQTSVSCEPMLDLRVDLVIDAVRPYVTEKIWLGRARNLVQIVSLNCPGDEEAREDAVELAHLWSNEAIWELYHRYKDDPMIRWKDSIKEVVGLERPTEKGLGV